MQPVGVARRQDPQLTPRRLRVATSRPRIVVVVRQATVSPVVATRALSGQNSVVPLRDLSLMFRCRRYPCQHSMATNARIQPVRAVDSTQVRTADRALGCNSLFVDFSTIRGRRHSAKPKPHQLSSRHRAEWQPTRCDPSLSQHYWTDCIEQNRWHLAEALCRAKISSR